ncbi:MAG: HNH endonuclease [Cyclobacteriaceae bacterium]
MYNQVTYPKEKIKKLLKDQFFTEKEMNVLIGYFSLENCEATVGNFAKYLGYSHFAPINGIAGRMGKKVAQKLNLPLRKRENGTEAGWDVIFEGESIKEGFLWRLKKPFSDAFRELEFDEMKIDNSITEELPKGIELYEGLKQTVTVNKYERNLLARSICLEKHGFTCKVCDFDFEKKYGQIGKEFIHVHHLKPIAEIGEKYKINPEEDLIPVCPNCHSMVHRNKSKTLTIDELKEKIKTEEDKS